MAEKGIVSKLDKKLITDGVINKAYMKDYAKVHKFLNTKVKKYDKALKEENFKICERDLRAWLKTLSKLGAGQDKLTSYLRSGMAHFCFDYIDLNNKKLKRDEHITRALQSFKKRNYDKYFFKGAQK